MRFSSQRVSHAFPQEERSDTELGTPVEDSLNGVFTEEVGERLNQQQTIKRLQLLGVNSYDGFLRYAIPLRTSSTVEREGGQIADQYFSSFNYAFKLAGHLKVISLS